jgi:hypothetical protein
MTRPPDLDKETIRLEVSDYVGTSWCLEEALKMFNMFERLSLNCLRSGALVSVSRTLKEGATSDPAKRFREYFRRNTINFVEFCPMERRE